MTGTFDSLASVSTSEWSPTRAMMPSTIEPRTLEVGQNAGGACQRGPASSRSARSGRQRGSASGELPPSVDRRTHREVSVRLSLTPSWTSELPRNIG
jgi:hypothetical protein